MRQPFLVAVTVFALLAAACGQSGSETQPESFGAREGQGATQGQAADGPPRERSADEAVGPEASGQGYIWRMSAEAVEVGEEGTVLLELTAQDPWHVNEEYPMTVRLAETASVNLQKMVLERGDAKTAGEHAVAFGVPFTAASTGTHRLVADVDFAVCTEESCVPEERQLAITIQASNGGS